MKGQECPSLPYSRPSRSFQSRQAHQLGQGLGILFPVSKTTGNFDHHLLWAAKVVILNQIFNIDKYLNPMNVAFGYNYFGIQIKTESPKQIRLQISEEIDHMAVSFRQKI